MSRKNLIVGQSGGPTAVINSSLYGVVSEGMRHPEAIEHVYGMILKSRSQVLTVQVSTTTGQSQQMMALIS